MPPPLSLSKNPGVDKGPQPLMFNPALTTCASERMKTQRFSYFAGLAAQARMREAKPVKREKVASSHFFDSLRLVPYGTRLCCALMSYLLNSPAKNLLTLPRNPVIFSVIVVTVFATLSLAVMAFSTVLVIDTSFSLSWLISSFSS